MLKPGSCFRSQLPRSNKGCNDTEKHEKDSRGKIVSKVESTCLLETLNVVFPKRAIQPTVYTI